MFNITRPQLAFDVSKPGAIACFLKGDAPHTFAVLQKYEYREIGRVLIQSNAMEYPEIEKPVDTNFGLMQPNN